MNMKNFSITFLFLQIFIYKSKACPSSPSTEIITNPQASSSTETNTELQASSEPKYTKTKNIKCQKYGKSVPILQKDERKNNDQSPDKSSHINKTKNDTEKKNIALRRNHNFCCSTNVFY